MSLYCIYKSTSCTVSRKKTNVNLQTYKRICVGAVVRFRKSEFYLMQYIMQSRMQYEELFLPICEFFFFFSHRNGLKNLQFLKTNPTIEGKKRLPVLT